jgi:hypothetical protein
MLAIAAHAAGDAMESEISAVEKASWEAWKARDASFYERTLSDDHLDVHGFFLQAGKGV